jgi:hypothetical protein
MAVFKPHGVQSPALQSSHPITLLATGIQFGKTTVGALWMKIQMHTHTSSDDNFLVVAPTYKILQQSTLPPLLRYLDTAPIKDKTRCLPSTRGEIVISEPELIQILSSVLLMYAQSTVTRLVCIPSTSGRTFKLVLHSRTLRSFLRRLLIL